MIMKKVLSWILALVLAFGVVPMYTFSVEATEAAHTHTYTPAVTFPARTEQGCTVYTCACGDTYRTAWLDENAYKGKTVACIGDSITAAYGVTKDETDYVKRLAERLGMDYIRLGVSGTTLCTDGSRTCNIDKLSESNLKGADVVTIAMGINDFCGAGAGCYKLGDIHSTDTSTIYGAVRMWCERIGELRTTDSLKDTQFYFVTPLITSWNNSVTSGRNWDQSKTNIHGYTLRELCNAIIEVAALYDVAVIDLNLLSGLYYVDAGDNNIGVFGGDGVHPGEEGHAMMAEAIANVLLQNHLRDDHAHTYGSWITTTWPSCAEGEQQRVCAICSATESRALESVSSHSYTAAVTAPTCTEAGYTTHTCACGESFVDSYVDAAGHIPGEAAKENETDIGYDLAVRCTLCGEELSREHCPVQRPGDINGDGKLNNKDVMLLMQYYAGWPVSVPEPLRDINGDGKQNNKDIMLLMQYLAGWDVTVYGA